MNFPSEKFSTEVNDQIIQNLKEVGFAIVDNIFDEEWTSSMREEIETLYQLNQLYSNKTYYQGRMEGGKFTYSYSVMKPNVHELDLLKPETREHTPYLDTMWKDKSMINHFNSKIPGLNLDCLDIKVQYNSGNGGCFPMHFDTTQEVSKRQITGTLYLNPNWKKGDGGELRVYPFPYYQVDVEPVNSRLVLFSSHQTLHRVLPANKERYVITLWFSGTPSEPQYPSFSWLKNVEGIGFIMNPMNRKSLAKVIYEEDWAQSIQESFNVGEDMDKVLESHRKDVETIKTKLGDSVLEFIGECLPLGHDDNFKQHLSKLA